MVDLHHTPHVLAMVKAERRRQNQKYPEDRNLAAQLWLTVLAEEFGEVARAILEDKPVDLETELVQVAATAVAWLEDIQYQKAKGLAII